LTYLWTCVRRSDLHCKASIYNFRLDYDW